MNKSTIGKTVFIVTLSAASFVCAADPSDTFICFKEQPKEFFRLIPQQGVTHLLTDDPAHNAVWDMAISPEGRVFFSSCGESYIPAYARLYEYDHAQKKLIRHFNLEEKIAQDAIGLRTSKFHTAMSFIGGGKMLTTTHTTSPSPRHPTWLPYPYYNHPYENYKGSDLLIYDYVNGEVKGLGKFTHHDTTYGATYDPKNGDYFATTSMRGEGLVYNIHDGSIRRLGQVTDTRTSRGFRMSDGHIYGSTYSGAIYRYNTDIRDIEYLGVSASGLIRHAVEIDKVMYFTTGSCGIMGRCLDLYSFDLRTHELKFVGKPVPAADCINPAAAEKPEYHAYGLAVDSKRRLWYGSLAVTPEIKYAGARLFVWDFLNGKEPVDCGFMGTPRQTLSICAEMRIVNDVLYISDGNHTGYTEAPCGIMAIDIEKFLAAVADPASPREFSHDFVNYLPYPKSCRKYYPKDDFDQECAKYVKYHEDVVLKFRKFAKDNAFRRPFPQITGISVWEKVGRKNAAVKAIRWNGPDSLSFQCGGDWVGEAEIDRDGRAHVKSLAHGTLPAVSPLKAKVPAARLPAVPGRRYLAEPESSVAFADGSVLVGTKDDMLGLVAPDGSVRNEGAVASSGGVHSLDLSPDGETVWGVAGHDQGVGMLFSYTRKGGTELFGLIPEAKAENGRQVAICRPRVVSVSPDGRRLAVGGDDEVAGVVILGLK